jgi:hypothetical protein
MHAIYDATYDPFGLQASGQVLAISDLIRRNAGRLGEHDEPKDKKRHASIEGCHSAPPPGARKPIFFRPVVRERLSVHVLSVAWFSAILLRSGPK